VDVLVVSISQLQDDIMSESAITLYTHQTPNGIKISITLEELGLPYKVYNINSTAMEQKSDWFLEINPNGRIPAIVDKLEDGTPIRVFESGSIMQYLVQRYDKDYRISYPPGSREQIEVRYSKAIIIHVNNPLKCSR